MGPLHPTTTFMLVPASLPSRSDRSATVLSLGYAPDWDSIAVRVRPSVAAIGSARKATAGEIEREAVVVAFAWFLGAETPGRATAATRMSVRQIATVAGLREARARDSLDLLAASGVLTGLDGLALALRPDAPVWDDQIVGRLADGLLRPAPAARVVRWDAVLDRAGGSTRALAAIAAFLDLVPVPTEWTSVSLAAVGAVARYTGRKMSEAVERAVGCGVIEERRERGSASLYRFAAAALHVPGPPDITAATSPRPSPDRVQQVSLPRRGSTQLAAPAASEVTDGTAMMRPVHGAATLMIGGIPFPLPPGARPQLEQDSDGRYWYRVGGVHFGPIAFE